MSEYWITRLDSLHALAFVMACLSGVIVLSLSINKVVCATVPSLRFADEKPIPARIWIASIIALVLGVLISVFVPDTRDYRAIVKAKERDRVVVITETSVK